MHGKDPSVDYLKSSVTIQVLPENEYLNFEYKIQSISIEDDLLKSSSLFSTIKMKSSKKNDPHVKLLSCSMNSPHSEGEKDAVSVLSVSGFKTDNDKDVEIIEEKISQNSLNLTTESVPCSEYSCLPCKKDFKTSDELLNHLKTSETAGMESKSVFICAKDNTPHWSLCHYLLHSNSIHDEKPPFVCTQCGQIFPQFSTFQHHMKLVCFEYYKRLRYECTHSSCSSLKLDNESSALGHMQNEHLKPVTQCAKCPQAFATPQWFLKHLTEIHQISVPEKLAVDFGISEIIVSYKDEELNSTNRDNYEKKTFESTLESMSKQLFQCQLCSIIFYTKQAYTQHLRAQSCLHTRLYHVYECPICLEDFLTSNDINNHYFKNHTERNELISGTSSVANVQKTSPMKNLTAVHKPVDRVVTATVTSAGPCIPLLSNKKCQYCTQPITVKSLRRHEDQCSRLANVPPVHCLACQKAMGRRIFRFQHGLKHLVAGKIVCLLCNNREIFPMDPDKDVSLSDQINALEKHLASSHASKVGLPYRCILCKKVLQERKLVEEHLINHHNIQRSTKRKRIGKHFSNGKSSPGDTSTKMDQKKTQNNTTEVNSLQYSCPFCDHGKFSDKVGIARHVIAVHKIDEKKLDLLDIYSLDKISHSKHKINDPMKKFKRRRIQEESIEAKSTDSVKNNSPPETNAQGHNGQVKYEEEEIQVVSDARDSEGNIKCLQCEDFGTTDENTFLSHVKSAHVWNEEAINRLFKEGKEKSDFWCPECSQIFVARPSFIMHLKSVHEFLVCRLDEYLEKTGYDGKKPLRQNQCEVCYQEFDNAMEYQNHIRTHGMAFLRLRQQRISSS